VLNYGNFYLREVFSHYIGIYLFVYFCIAHFAAPLASKILQQNEEDFSGIHVNLVGLIMFAPCLDLVNQSTDFGSYLYNFGLITKDDKDKHDQESSSISTLSAEKRCTEAAEVGWLSAAVSKFLLGIYHINRFV